MFELEKEAKDYMHLHNADVYLIFFFKKVRYSQKYLGIIVAPPLGVVPESNVHVLFVCGGGACVREGGSSYLFFVVDFINF